MPLRMTEVVPISADAAPTRSSLTTQTSDTTSTRPTRRAGPRAATKKGGAKIAATSRAKTRATTRARDESSARAESAGKRLPVPRRKQGQGDWCWAACVDMVMHYFGRPEVKQCAVVAKKIGRREVCAHPHRKEFSVACPPRSMSTVWRSWGLKSKAHIPSRGRRGWLTEEELVAELDAGRPVEIGFKWEWGGGHAVVVHGWRAGAGGRRYFFVNDPWNWSGERFVEGLDDGIGQVSYEDLRQGYGMGRWKWTWSGLSPRG